MVKKGNTKGWHWEYWKACFESHLVEKDNTHLLRILALEIYGLVLFLFDIKIIDEGGALNIFAEVETPGILAILLCGSIHRKRGIQPYFGHIPGSIETAPSFLERKDKGIRYWL